jgi:hypothetical protein
MPNAKRLDPMMAEGDPRDVEAAPIEDCDCPACEFEKGLAHAMEVAANQLIEWKDGNVEAAVRAIAGRMCRQLGSYLARAKGVSIANEEIFAEIVSSRQYEALLQSPGDRDDA